MVSKKILIRAGVSPLEQLSVREILSGNLLGNNNGNLAYQFSVFRTLQLPDVELVPTRYKVNRKDADKINNEYESVVLPFANAFKNKSNAIGELREYTALIKKLNVPVTVIGIGLQAPTETKPGDKFPFDDDVRAFVAAVLEKSSIIGVRGQITANYLSGLGFVEGRDHMVIGCPSMYTYGDTLHIRNPKELTENSRIFVNSVPNAKSGKYDAMYKFINDNMAKYANHHFVPTENEELLLTYAGVGTVKHKYDGYPADATSQQYASGRVSFPVNVHSWINMFTDADLVYGARLHGCISAMLAGAPTMMFPKDARMKELVEYHGFTTVDPMTITDETTLEELVTSVDFQAPTKKQKANFAHYVEFLDKNNLDHIWKSGDYSKKDTVFEERLKAINPMPPIESFSIVSRDELVRRFNDIDAMRRAEYQAKLREYEATQRSISKQGKKNLPKTVLGYIRKALK